MIVIENLEKLKGLCFSEVQEIVRHRRKETHVLGIEDWRLDLGGMDCSYEWNVCCLNHFSGFGIFEPYVRVPYIAGREGNICFTAISKEGGIIGEVSGNCWQNIVCNFISNEIACNRPNIKEKFEDGHIGFGCFGGYTTSEIITSIIFLSDFLLDK